ncbi:urease accessory protein UreF [Pseudothioclava arenosa]|uniref:Urease accessory protein UreF n=1 Tax=Pseudothioclava arenosa TaxID=1795308 RepID=A0A2A4CSH4_9RHOB|nr:urease accessory UreF family protein [Pseudothioclava arenosa]PCD77099.1 urease accessory protein UreF [Pseudothioclava arenosa]
MAEADDLALLRLVQWLSPAFPTGAFAYSHGLEQAIASGDVRDEEGFAAWLADILDYGAGWNDAVLLACGLRGEPLDALADLARALAGSAERLRETTEQGSAFGRALAEMTGRKAAASEPLPVALARSGRELGLPVERIIAVFLHSFASNLVSAGVRFIPLGQSAGQRVLAEQHLRIAGIAARAASAGRGDLASSAFRAEMQAMAHETLDVRIFKT